MAVPAVFRKYNEISLIKRILVGLAVGIVLALLIPNVQPLTDIITLLGSLFVGRFEGRRSRARVLPGHQCPLQRPGRRHHENRRHPLHGSTLVAAIVALIGSELFLTSSHPDTSSMVEQAAPRGSGERSPRCS
ncbi:MAG: hypothetical protein ACLUE1_05310 [Adlercreutzia equolifaciens]